MDTLIDLSEDVPVAPVVASLVPPSEDKAPLLNNFVLSTRTSLDNNPFDRAMRQAERFDDPFECVHNMAMQKCIEQSPHATGIATGTLIQLDTAENAGQVPTNHIDIATEEPTTPLRRNGPNDQSKSGRTHSDSDISGLLRSIKSKSPIANKTRSNSLDQLVRRNQLLKFSIANSSINAFSPRPILLPNHPVEHQLIDPTGMSPRSREESFDDLNSTSPQWIDSEADDSDIEQMVIPFLKRRQASEEELAAADEKPKAQKNLLLEQHEQLVGQLDRHHKASSTPPTMPVVHEEEAGRIQPDHPEIVITSPTNTGREQLASLLDSVKQAIQNYDNHSEAKAMLANLNSALEMTNNATDTALMPTPIIRQGTFNLEDQETSPGASSIAASDDQPSSAEASPNSTNVANVVEQLGRMNLNPQCLNMLENFLIMPNAAAASNSGAAAPTTYIVVMNPPSAQVSKQNTSPPLASDEDSPSSYLKTRKLRSHSLNLHHKPSSVATALAAKAALRNHVNSLAPTTPIRPTARRSSFSHSIGAQPANPSKATAAPPRAQKSPIRAPKSPSKLNAYPRRQSISGRPKPSGTTVPTLLHATTATSSLKLRVSSEMSRPTARSGPMRATIPIKSVAPVKRATAAVSPQRSSIARPVGLSTPVAGGTPRRQPATGLQRPSMGYISATPGAKRLNPMTASASAAARRRTMSEGKYIAPTSGTPTPPAGGVSNLPRFTTPIKRLSTIPTKFGTANKENKFPK